MDASKKSPLHLVHALEPEAGLVPCRREAATQTVENSGYRILSTEGNQKSPREDMQVWLSDLAARKEMLSCRRRARTHLDGLARCRLAAGFAEQTAAAYNGWPGFKAIGKIEAISARKGKEERCVRYFIMSAESRPEPARNRWHERGPNAEPNSERAGVPRRHER